MKIAEYKNKKVLIINEGSNWIQVQDTNGFPFIIRSLAIIKTLDGQTKAVYIDDLTNIEDFTIEGEN